MLLLLLAACVENTLTPKDDEGFDSGDSAPVDPEDTEETAVHTGDSDSARDCPDLPPTDSPVTVDAECTDAGAFDGEIVERWSVPMDSFADELGVVRTEDGDGDGDVDTQDPATLWVSDGWGTIRLLDADGVERSRRHAGSYRVWATGGDVDPASPGAEVLAMGYTWEGYSFVGVGDAATASWEVPTLEEWANYPWLADLEGDGVPELLLGYAVLDPTTGAPLVELEGGWSEDVTPAVSADLDRDGVEEIVAADWGAGKVNLYNPDGEMIASCVGDGGPNYNASYAIGNLDADADGELVAAGDGYVVVCDADGAVLRRTDVGTVQPSLVGIAELDGDEGAELLVAERGELLALDTDLSVLWTWRPPLVEWVPFSVADLDGDGRHEVLVNAHPALVILDGSGAEVTRWESGEAELGYAWRSQPVVADLDGDGRAEIVLGGYSVHVLSSPDGGWQVRGAEADWPAADHHPEDRVDGVVTGPHAWWATPSSNVWQGLPAGPVGGAELSVGFGEVCVEGCPGEAVVELRVRNRSALPVEAPITLQVYDQATGALLVELPLDTPFPGGTERSLSVRLPAEQLGAGLRAVVQTEAAQCGAWPDEASFQDQVCP